MRILIVHTRYQQKGGEDTAVALDAELLKERGHEVEILYFDNEDLKKENKLSQINIALFNQDSAKTLKLIIDRFRPQVIHIHNLYFVGSPSIMDLAHKEGIPTVFTLHNYRMVCANVLLLRDGQICEKCVDKKFPLAGVRYKCYRNSAAESALVTMITGWQKLTGGWRRKVNRYIALTEFAKSKLLKSSFNVHPEQIIVKPNHVPDPGENNSLRKDHYLFVGRLSVEKGVKYLCEAFSKIPGKRLLLAGDGPEGNALRQEFSRFENISFVGQQDRSAVLTLIREAKALIVPSIWYEGLPFTILEAFSYGTPVLASALGGMKETVIDGVNGFLFKEKDPDSICNAMIAFENILQSDNSIYRLTRETYLKRYHPDIAYENLMEIYSGVMQEETASK